MGIMNNIFISFRKRCFFVDLFVRVSNKVAVDMYTRLGYSVYRRVLEYYSGEVDEDAFGELFMGIYCLMLFWIFRLVLALSGLGQIKKWMMLTRSKRPKCIILYTLNTMIWEEIDLSNEWMHHNLGMSPISSKMSDVDLFFQMT